MLFTSLLTSPKKKEKMLHNTLKLGKLAGKLLVFGGVYSNLEALLALKKVATEMEIPTQNIICTGDIVGYCADPSACLTHVKDWGIHSILGNVELQLRSGDDSCGCNFEDGSTCDLLSKSWYPYAQSQVDEDQIEWLKTLPEFITFNYCGKKFFVLHGSIKESAEFIFASTKDEVFLENFEKTGADIILAGHSGIPFSKQMDEKLWLNAGVIGMPANDGTASVWYLIIDSLGDEIKYQYKSLNYDYHLAQTKMLAKALPKAYAQTLTTGIWDNCDVLPEEETRQQGVALRL